MEAMVGDMIFGMDHPILERSQAIHQVPYSPIKLLTSINLEKKTPIPIVSNTEPLWILCKMPASTLDMSRSLSILVINFFYGSISLL